LKKSQVLVFRPFPQLPDAAACTALTARIEEFIALHEYSKAESACKHLIDLCIEGLRYYQTYAVAVSYLGGYDNFTNWFNRVMLV